MHVHIYEPKICTYACINYIRKIFFQSIFSFRTWAPSWGGYFHHVCVCARARACAHVRVCVYLGAIFGGGYFYGVHTVHTAGGKDSVVLSDTSCTCVREIEGSGGRAGRGLNE